jgi:hypothetical protein
MESRLARARRRVRTVRVALVAVTVAAFGGLAAAARLSHPGARHSSRSLEPAAAFDSASAEDDFGFGNGSVGSSDGAAPQVQSSSS